MKKVIIIVCWALFPLSLLSQSSKIRFVTDSLSPNFGKIVFSSKDELEEDKLPVYYGNYEDEPTRVPTLLGDYAQEGTSVIFTPRFPFTQGKTYTAFMTGEGIKKTFEVPGIVSYNVNTVKNFYPSGNHVPANLLKFYIIFENPMRHGQAYRNIVLIKDSKDTIDAPFLEFEQELWDKEQKLLTIWLDPGRIKRDLSPNQLLGNPLEAGSEYDLIINKDWIDIYGQTLQTDFVKNFIVEDYDREKPEESSWSIIYPAKNSLEALVIEFREILDYGTLSNNFQVEKSGEIIETELAISNHEKTVRMIPVKSWKPGSYKLYINTDLEDLAGNNMNRLFDTDLSTNSSAEKSREEITIGFYVE